MSKMLNVLKADLLNARKDKTMTFGQKVAVRAKKLIFRIRNKIFKTLRTLSTY
jgi:hypothetical protein